MSKQIDIHRKPVITTGRGVSISTVAQQPKITTGTGKIVNKGKLVDIVFVFDTTGSMENEIAGLLRTCTQFVDETLKLELDAQFALISFGDISVHGGGDRIEVVVSPTANVEKMKQGLSHIPRNNGFGNEGESCLQAIQQAFELNYRDNAVKVMVLITDEPAHQDQISVNQIINELVKREYLAFVIAIDQPYYREMAKRNGGIWKEVGPSTSLDEILVLFREIAKKVSQVVNEVHEVAKGSVSRYLQLKPPSK